MELFFWLTAGVLDLSSRCRVLHVRVPRVSREQDSDLESVWAQSELLVRWQ